MEGNGIQGMQTLLRGDIFKGVGVNDLFTEGGIDILCDEEDGQETEG